MVLDIVQSLAALIFLHCLQVSLHAIRVAKINNLIELDF